MVNFDFFGSQSDDYNQMASVSRCPSALSFVLWSHLAIIPPQVSQRETLGADPTQNPQENQASLTHEVLGGGVAYEAMKA